MSTAVVPSPAAWCCGTSTVARPHVDRVVSPPAPGVVSGGDGRRTTRPGSGQRRPARGEAARLAAAAGAFAIALTRPRHGGILCRGKRVRRSALDPQVADEKAKFLALLASKGGDCNDEEVLAAVDELSKSNPTKDAACTEAYLDADWRQVSKSTFPGAIGDEVYTLGRLAFSLYQPTDMQWKIEQTLNPVRPVEAGDESEDGTRAYEFWIDVTCVDDRYPKFKGIMKNFGRCKPDAKNKDRLEVWFTGGSLAPAPGMDSALLPEWKETFGAAMGAKKPTFLSSLGDWAMKLMMGLQKPDEVKVDGTMEYVMARAPHGYTDILYMDEDLRITKGNAGSVVVVDRSPVAAA